MVVEYLSLPNSILFFGPEAHYSYWSAQIPNRLDGGGVMGIKVLKIDPFFVPPPLPWNFQNLSWGSVISPAFNPQAQRMFTVGTRNGNLQRYGPRPTTCWPTICWPTTCWPTTCWPTTCWPTTCWPTTGWPTSCCSTTCGWTHHLLTHYLLTLHRLTHYLLTYHLRTQCKKYPLTCELLTRHLLTF